MKATIKNGDLVITIPMQEPTPSASGKTMVVASSHGNKAVSVDGQVITIGVNAYIPKS